MVRTAWLLFALITLRAISTQEYQRIYSGYIVGKKEVNIVGLKDTTISDMW